MHGSTHSARSTRNNVWTGQGRMRAGSGPPCLSMPQLYTVPAAAATMPSRGRTARRPGIRTAPAAHGCTSASECTMHACRHACMRMEEKAAPAWDGAVGCLADAEGACAVAVAVRCGCGGGVGCSSVPHASPGGMMRGFAHNKPYSWLLTCTSDSRDVMGVPAARIGHAAVQHITSHFLAAAAGRANR